MDSFVAHKWSNFQTVQTPLSKLRKFKNCKINIDAILSQIVCAILAQILSQIFCD